jgi:hypothetical protein
MGLQQAYLVQVGGTKSKGSTNFVSFQIAHTYPQ